MNRPDAPSTLSVSLYSRCVGLAAAEQGSGWPRQSGRSVRGSCVVRGATGVRLRDSVTRPESNSLWRDKRKKLNGSLILADPKLTRDDNPIISSGLPESHSPWTVRLRNRIRNENIQHFVPFLLVPYCTL